ncbi:hypothetical protein ACFQ71_36225 [Streptomyces sp. NPDC056534]|uniref:hypothetical protein n=1 Tax=Streptomyces sp. NPDC056534 TaxID=3345857 RepID=UPI0036846ACC
MTEHIQGLIAQRPDLPVAAIARKAGVAPSTLKSLLTDARRGPDAARTVSRATAVRLLAVALDGLPHRDRGYGGRSTNAAPALRRIRALLTAHPHLSQAALARAAGISLTTLAAALHDVDVGRPRRIQAAAADRLLALGTRTPLPEHATRRDNTVDAQPVADHIRALQVRYDRASTAFIATVAGVDASTLASALIDHKRDGRRGINTNIARRVLAVRDLPPPAFPRRTHVTEIGLLRRLRGMCAVGWPLPAIAQADATTAKSLTDFARTGISTPAVRGAILAAWDRLAHRPGPSAQARQRAAAKAWNPPLAWDEHSINDPDTLSSGTRIPGRSQHWDPSVLRHEIAFFTHHLGLGRPECLRHLGLSTRRARQLLHPPPPAPTTPPPRNEHLAVRRVRDTAPPVRPARSSTDRSVMRIALSARAPPGARFLRF